MKTQRIIRAAIVLLLFIVATEFAQAQTKDTEAAKVLNDYVTAVGGKNAVDNILNLMSKSELDFVGAGFKLSRNIAETRAGKYYIKVSSLQTGDIIRTINDTVCKEQRLGDVHDIEGEEKESFRNTSAFLRFAEWEKTLAGYKYEGAEKVDGVKMHKLKVATVFGQNEFWYFDAKSGLLTQIEEELEMPGGKSKSTTVYSDYRDVNGVKLSFRQTINMPGQTREITFSEILANQKIDTAMFKLD